MSKSTVTPEQRERVIRDVAARKAAEAKIAKAPQVGVGPTSASSLASATMTATLTPDAKPGSKADKLARAVAPGVVKPAAKPAPTKIPKALNATRLDDTSTVTEPPTSAVDKELDASVAVASDKRKAKRLADPTMLTVSDVAREAGVDPKHARARLRAAGKAAVEGRWSKVKRDSDEHKELANLIQKSPDVVD